MFSAAYSCGSIAATMASVISSCTAKTSATSRSSVRPDVAAVGDIVELRGDADTAAALSNAALEDIADAELFADLLHIDGLPL